MADSLSKLCASCEGFDVRSLLTITESQHPRSGRNNNDLIRPGLKQFFAQHMSLKELKTCAIEESCEFCCAIWRSYKNTSNAPDHDESDDELHRGLGGQPIFLGTEDRNISQQSLTHVVVFQPSENKSAIYRRLACFEICTSHDVEVDSDGHLMARVQAASSNDNQVFELARSWIENCERGHDQCRPSIRENLRRPTRLLGIDRAMCMHDEDFEECKVRLIEGQRQSEPFAALSYCWGVPAINSFVLDSSTNAQLFDGVALSSLPATLRDAVVTASRLGLDRLWIDALCIRQDDQEDWALESGHMGDIYRGATVTIEAAAANDSHDGFLKDRCSSMPYCKMPWQNNGDQLSHVQLRPVEDLSDSQLYGTRLYSRGWTLQERLLASRTLSFGNQQISFECINGHRQEARLIGQPTTLMTAKVLSKAVLNQIRNADEWYLRIIRAAFKFVGLYPSFTLLNQKCIVEPALHMPLGEGPHPVRTYRQIWGTLVHLYSQRCLSNNSDRLPAISGLASEFQRYMGDPYVAGLWKNDLIVSLGWESSDLHRAESMKGKVVPSLLIYDNELVDRWPYGIRDGSNVYTPSWSWASVRGPVRLPDENQIEIRALASLVESHLVPKFNDPNGLLAEAGIQIRAQFLSIPDPQSPRSVPEGSPFPRLLAKLRTVVKYYPDRASEFYQQHRSHDGQVFALVKLYKWSRRLYEILLPNLQLLLIESCGERSFRRLTSFRLNYPQTDKEFVRWHMYDDIKSSRMVQRQIDADEYLRLYGDDIEDARALTAELNSGLWQEQTVRLV